MSPPLLFFEKKHSLVRKMDPDEERGLALEEHRERMAEVPSFTNVGGKSTMGAYHAGADNMAEKESPSDEVETIWHPPMAPRVTLTNDNDDDESLSKLRERRLAELKEQQARAKFGTGVLLIDKDEWQRQVVGVSKEAWVVVHLYLASNPFCDAIYTALNVLSTQQPTVHFVQIKAEFAMPPSKFHLLPSLFCYSNGTLAKRLIGKEITANGAPTAPALEWMLAELGVLETDLEEAPPASSFGRANKARQRDEEPDAFAPIDYSTAEMD
jgi:hypothetical protein